MAIKRNQVSKVQRRINVLFSEVAEKLDECNAKDSVREIVALIFEDTLNRIFCGAAKEGHNAL